MYPSSFVAGTNATATSLLWAVFLMAKYPEIQRKVQAELDKVVGAGLYPKSADRAYLPFTEATLCEIQRFASVLPLAMPHRVMEDAQLCGYDIPKDAVMLANIWAVHHDPAIWSNPEIFDPLNFYDESTDPARLKKTDSLIPFSLGTLIVLIVNIILKLNCLIY